MTWSNSYSAAQKRAVSTVFSEMSSCGRTESACSLARPVNTAGTFMTYDLQRARRCSTHARHAVGWGGGHSVPHGHLGTWLCSSSLKSPMAPSRGAWLWCPSLGGMQALRRGHMAPVTAEVSAVCSHLTGQRPQPVTMKGERTKQVTVCATQLAHLYVP